jgi:hypothetical protein
MQQITDAILMVRPARFGYDQETAASNTFQVNDQGLSPAQVEEKGVREFDAMVAHLRNYGIQIWVIEDTLIPEKPSAVFPNNWFSTHADGTLITYPLLAPNRRAERRKEIPDFLSQHYQIKRHLHLEEEEKNKRYLEGTGSLILDRVNRIAYACRSDRTHPLLFRQFCERMEFRGILFDAVDERGKPIYHTNVMMAIGETLAVVNLSAISKRDAVITAMRLGVKSYLIKPLQPDEIRRKATEVLQRPL